MGIPTKVPIDLVNPTPAAANDAITVNTEQNITGLKRFKQTIVLKMIIYPLQLILGMVEIFLLGLAHLMVRTVR